MKKLIISLLCFGGLLFGGVINPQSAHAATYSLKVFPKVLRHTWYHYDGHGRYDQIKFGYKHYRMRNFYEKWYVYNGKIHYRNLKATRISHHPNWTFATPVYYHRMHWTNIYGWNEGVGDGAYYGVKIRRYHGHRVRVMSEASGADIWTDSHYYATRKVAKALGNKHFPGVLYYPKI